MALTLAWQPSAPHQEAARRLPQPTAAAARLAQGLSTSGRGQPWLRCVPRHLCCLPLPAALTLAWQPSALHQEAACHLPQPTIIAAWLAQGLTLALLRASSPVLPPPACGPHPRMAAFGTTPGSHTPPPLANRRSSSVSIGPERIRQGPTLAPLCTSSPVLPPPACGPHPHMAAFVTRASQLKGSV